MNEILKYSATRQAALVRQRQVSSHELVAAHLDRISEVDPRIHATVEVLAERALAEAGAADAALGRGEAPGPLHGVPFSIKDSIEVGGNRLLGWHAGPAARRSINQGCHAGRAFAPRRRHPHRQDQPARPALRL